MQKNLPTKVDVQLSSRYLYSKVGEARTKFIPLLLSEEEIIFLKKNNVEFYKDDVKIYQVDASKLKALFCH